MHVQISCEECGRRYKIAESTVRGKRIYTRCKCGARVVVEDPMRNGVPSSTTGSIHRKERWFVNITTSEPLAMGLDSLVRAFEVGRVDPETLVWRRGMVEWAPLRSVKELSTLLLGESAGAQLPSMPPPGNGLSVPPPTPSEVAQGAQPAALPTGQAFRLQLGKSTQTGLPVAPADTTAPDVHQPQSSQRPPSSTARELRQLADSLDASGPPTERLAGGPPSSESEPLPQSAEAKSTAAGFSPPGGKGEARQGKGAPVPINLAEPTTSAQTPISMSSSGTGRSHTPLPTSAETRARPYRLVGSLLAAAAVVAIVTLRPAPSTPEGPSAPASQPSHAPRASAAASELRHEPDPLDRPLQPLVEQAAPQAELGDVSPPASSPRPSGPGEGLKSLARNPSSVSATSKPLQGQPVTDSRAPESRSEATPKHSPPLPAAAQATSVASTRDAKHPAKVPVEPAPRPAVSAASPAMPEKKRQPAAPKPQSPPRKAAPASAASALPPAKSVAQPPPSARSNSKTVSAAAKPPPAQPAEERDERNTQVPKGLPEPSAQPVPRPFSLETALTQAQLAAEQSALCVGPTERGKVDITIEPWGTVSRVKHLNQDLVGTSQGLCIMVAYQKVRVPAFDGESQTLRHAFIVQKH